MRLAHLALAVTLCSACATDDPIDHHNASVERIACTDTPDCAMRGGTCVAGECHAANECAGDADCDADETCVPDENFGGLCATTAEAAMPLPAWACTTSLDCPAYQGCGDDGVCHIDGECSDALPCADGMLCYNAGNDSDAGYCASDRPMNDPYCRSDGLGACRTECLSDGTCAWGDCVDGFCHDADECVSEDDCSPSFDCTPVDGYGYSLCAEAADPTCVDDGLGACRLPCVTDLDCIHGGGCADDGLCHASNECATDDDCEDPLICYADPEFGGLCGADRP
jgi:hypothetical protein